MDEKPWLRHYDTGVPHTLAPYPKLTLLDCIRETVSERPDHPFLFFKGRRLGYGEVDRLSDRLAAALGAEGVRKGDRVALILVNSPQSVIAQLAVWKAGGIAVPLNPLWTREELEPALAHVGATVAIVLTLAYERVKAIQRRTGVRRIIATNIKEYLPRHSAVLFTLFKEKRAGHRISLAGDDRWLADLIRTAPGDRPAVPVGPDDTSLLLFTGGTTGTPKAACLRHQDMLIASLQWRAWAHGTIPDWESTTVLLMPLFHVYGQGVLSTAIVAHCQAALVPDPRNIGDVLATIHATRPAMVPAVPTFYAALLEHPRVKTGKVSLRSIKVCSSGAAPLMSDTKDRFEAATGGRLLEGYALTESAMAMCANPIDGPNKPGSVGMPLPDVEVRIVDPETGGTTLPSGSVGEIAMRAPQVIRGYWGAPPDTQSMLREGWLYTGDLGYMDEEGYVFIVDRKKDLMKPSGFQVWPREVEEVIATHPAVAEVAVAGVQDPHQVEAVKAWIVLKDGTETTADAIRSHCREHLAAYKVPRHVEFRTSLPKTLVGKVLRRALRDEAATPYAS